MKLTDERLYEILAGCEGVVPGPWHRPAASSAIEKALGGPVGVVNSDAGLVVVAREGKELERYKVNLDHIARLDPETVSSLVTELLDARAAIPKMTARKPEELIALVATVRERVAAGKLDLRDVGLLFTGKWDQDAPAALLEAADTIAALVRERDEARGALKPYAAVADAYSDREDDRFETWVDCHEPVVKESTKLVHARRARSALGTDK